MKPAGSGGNPKNRSVDLKPGLAMNYGTFGETTNLLLFVAELVANSPNGENHLRVFRVLFDFGAQPVDV